MSVDAALPLSGGLSVMGQSVVIGNGCGVLVEQPTRVAVANFTSASLSGTVTLRQAFSGEATHIEADLQGVPAGGLSWGVFTLPVGSSSCVDVGEVYNPRGVASSAAAGCTATSRLRNQACAMGDLSVRVGPLTGTLMFDGTLFVLPLTGEHSVVGRAMVAWNSVTGERVGCATIGADGGAGAVVSEAAFTSGALHGSVKLTQDVGAVSGTTQLLVDLTTSVTSSRRRSTPTAYPWSITNGCTSSATVYNPTGATSASGMAGNLAARYGELTLPAKGDTRVLVGVSGLPLQGAQSVVGQSLMIGTPSNIVACTPIVLGFTAVPDEAQRDTGDGGGMSQGALIGIVVGVLSLLIVAVFAVVIRRRKSGGDAIQMGGMAGGGHYKLNDEDGSTDDAAGGYRPWSDA